MQAQGYQPFLVVIAMGKRWKTIVGFAALGFAITAAFYIDGVYKDYTKPDGLLDTVVVMANIILCPPVLCVH